MARATRKRLSDAESILQGYDGNNKQIAPMGQDGAPEEALSLNTLVYRRCNASRCNRKGRQERKGSKREKNKPGFSVQRKDAPVRKEA